MSDPLQRRPDVLVLAAGGTLGEAWMSGLLSGIESETAIDFRACEHFVGTSAGSIVAATLAAGRSPREAGEPEAGLGAEGSAAVAGGLGPGGFPGAVLGGLGRAAALAAVPLAPLALAGAAPGGALARSALLRLSPAPRASLTQLGAYVRSLRTRFDGRLRICVVDRGSGRRVIFGAPRAPAASVTDAVLASCAVPWIFPAQRIGAREYVDGGVWSPTNLDAAPVGRGAEVLCLNPTASLAAAGSPFGLLRLASQGAATVEALALRGRGASVRTLAPDAAAARAMGVNLMDPARRAEVLAAGFRQGRALGMG